MSDELLAYYNSELTYLRELGSELPGINTLHSRPVSQGSCRVSLQGEFPYRQKRIK